MKSLVFITLLILATKISAEESCIKKEAFKKCVTFTELFLQGKNELLKNTKKSLNQTFLPNTKKYSYIEFSQKNSKSYKPRKECENPDLEWKEFVKCTNEKMSFYKSHKQPKK